MRVRAPPALRAPFSFSVQPEGEQHTTDRKTGIAMKTPITPRSLPPNNTAKITSAGCKLHAVADNERRENAASRF